jgi:hypothetical protein
MCGLNACLGSLEEEAFDAFVAEALNHEKSVSRYDTRVNSWCHAEEPRQVQLRPYSIRKRIGFPVDFRNRSGERQNRKLLINLVGVRGFDSRLRRSGLRPARRASVGAARLG